MSNVMTFETVNQLLQQQKKQIELALPNNINAERFMRIFLTEIRRTPKLLECSKASLFGSMMISAQLGLEPGSVLGHAYLIPYKTECTFILGYKGMIQLINRSGKVGAIQANGVYQNDKFEFEYGLNPKLSHIPSSEDRGKFIGAYSVVYLKDGGYQFVVMYHNEIEKIRLQSKAAKSEYSPWNHFYEEMAKKTTIRRLFKYLPVSVEVERAISYDEQADAGIQKFEDLDFSLENVEQNPNNNDEQKG